MKKPINKLLYLREKFCLTQDELGEAIDGTPQSICAWENGRGIPSVTKMKKLRDFFGADNICKEDFVKFRKAIKKGK